MSRSEFCRVNKVKRWKLIKCIEMLRLGYSIRLIRRKLKLSTKNILKIEVIFVKKREQVFTKLGSKNEAYHKDESEMQMQDYDNCILQGQELIIFNNLICG